MEVHHHAHVKEKKFKEYFFEFLMIFLAVTLGFIAENVREEISNHAKEKAYMKSMLQDVISDTTMLNKSISFVSAIGAGLDSLSKALYAANRTDSSVYKIYRLHAMYSRLISVSFNDQTTIQLRNSGGMQLIKTAIVKSAIANYWKGIESIDMVIDNMNYPSTTDFAYSIFNRSYEHFAGADPATGMSLVSIDRGARFMTNDKNQLINYANRITRTVTIINSFLLKNLKYQKKRAAALIGLIKNEYHLKS